MKEPSGMGGRNPDGRCSADQRKRCALTAGRKKETVFISVLSITLAVSCSNLLYGCLQKVCPSLAGSHTAAGESMVQEYQRANPDFFGILSMPGVIEAPVVQGNDNSYYLSHSFEKDPDSGGCLFADADYLAGSSNLVIYGHNNYDDALFSRLVRFRDADYVRKHLEIRLTDRECTEHRYRIILVMNYNTEDLLLFNPYQASIKMSDVKNSYLMYPIYYCSRDFSTVCSNSFLTLSTCDETVYGQCGRLLVVGEEI